MLRGDPRTRLPLHMTTSKDVVIFLPTGFGPAALGIFDLNNPWLQVRLSAAGRCYRRLLYGASTASQRCLVLQRFGTLATASTLRDCMLKWTVIYCTRKARWFKSQLPAKPRKASSPRLPLHDLVLSYEVFSYIMTDSDPRVARGPPNPSPAP